MTRWGSGLIVVGVGLSCEACAASSRDVPEARPPSSCAAFEPGIEIDATRLALTSPRADEIAMLGQRVADAASAAATLRGSVALECRRIALENDADERAIRRIDADESAPDRAKNACALAAEALRKRRAQASPAERAQRAALAAQTNTRPLSEGASREPNAPSASCASGERVLSALLTRCRAADDMCIMHARRAAEHRDTCPARAKTVREHAPEREKSIGDEGAIDAPVLVLAARLRGRRWADRIVATAEAANAELARSAELSMDERMCLRTFAATAETARADALAAIEAAATVVEP